MRTPFSRARRRSAILSPGGVLAILVVLVIVILLFLLRAFFPGSIATLARPFWAAGDGLTGIGGSVAAFFGDKVHIVAERDALSREVVVLQEQNAALRARAHDLEQLLGGRSNAATQLLAGVLARPPVAPYDTLVIDRGSADGVRVGQQVLGAGGVPLGTIESMGPHTARVLLYSAPGRVTEGWAGEARVPVSLEGASAGAFRTSVSRDSALAVGDAIYVPGPGAVPIGTVVRVDTDPSSPEARMYVRPRANPFSITWVSVVP